MIKPVQVLVLSLATLGVSTLHSIKVPPTAAGGARMLPPVAALIAAQTSIAVIAQRERHSSVCTMDGARDRSRANTCSSQ